MDGEGSIPHVEQRDEQGVRILEVLERKLGWDIDAQQLKARLMKGIAGVGLAAVDMSEVHFLASPTIGTILSFRRDASEAGCTVAFFSMRQYVRDTFVTLGLTDVIKVCRDETEAIEWLKESADQ